MGLGHDTVFVSEKEVLESQLDDEMESLQIFIKLTEEDRRERNLRLDMGDEAAKLKISNQYARKQDRNQGGQQGWNQGGNQGQRQQDWQGNQKQDWHGNQKQDWHGNQNKGDWGSSG